jgi:hypothetical protein
MRRDEWTFQFPASSILESTRRKAAHHRSRQKWWQGELDKTTGEIKTHGIEIAEFEGTHARRLDWKVDDTLDRRYRECAAKVERHRTAADDYETWIRTLELNADAVLVLDRDDIGYFGL